MKRKVKLPRIGPCNDPLELWFLEFRDRGCVMRRYYADEVDAKAALAEYVELSFDFGLQKERYATSGE